MNVGTLSSYSQTFDDYDDDPLPNKEDWDPFPGGRAQAAHKPAPKPARKDDFDDDDDDDWDAAFAKKNTSAPVQPAPTQPTAKPAQPVHQPTPVPVPTSTPFNPFDNVSSGSLLGGGTGTPSNVIDWNFTLVYT